MNLFLTRAQRLALAACAGTFLVPAQAQQPQPASPPAAQPAPAAPAASAALADAVPGDFTPDEIHRLGQLLGLAVPVSESYWLADRLQRGTEKLGGTDPAKRLLAGRMLLAGGFKDLARAWLPPREQVPQIQ